VAAGTLSYAIEHYFEHGGRHAVVVRVIRRGACHHRVTLRQRDVDVGSTGAGQPVSFCASVDYDNLGGDQDLDCFNLWCSECAHRSEHIEEQESYRRVSISPATDVSSAGSGRVRIARVRGEVPHNGGCHPHARMHGRLRDSSPDGNDGAPLSDYDLIGSAADRSGLFALSMLDRVDFVYLPPLSRDSGSWPECAGCGGLRFCRDRHAMLIVDPPQAWNACQTALSGLRQLNFYCDHAVMFFPRLVGHDRLRGRPEVFANGGAVAGLLSPLMKSARRITSGRTGIVVGGCAAARAD
jgi:hypothetical protein